MNSKTLLAAALALPLLAVSATAQVGGSINRDAPSVTRSITFKNGDKLQATYTAIHFGEGAWQSILKATDRHERFNANAPKRPIGSINISAGVTASGRTIPAGKYDLFFTVNEQAGWILNLRPKSGGDEAKDIRWRMAMKDTDTQYNRFSLNLIPGDKAGSCDIAIAFGKKTVTVPLKVGAVAEKKEKKQG